MKNLFLLIIFTISISCSSSDNRLECIPIRSVNKSVFISNNLTTGGQSLSVFNVGIKGIVIYKKLLGGFAAYDLQAPHLCFDNKKSTLKISGGQLVGDDKSVFDMESGNVLIGANRNLIQYRVVQNSSSLITVTSF